MGASLRGIRTLSLFLPFGFHRLAWAGELLLPVRFWRSTLIVISWPLWLTWWPVGAAALADDGFLQCLSLQPGSLGTVLHPFVVCAWFLPSLFLDDAGNLCSSVCCIR